MLFSVLTSFKVQLSPSRVLALAKRRQISVGSSLRARSPNLAKLSSLPCTQPTLPSVSSGCPKVGRPGLTDCNPGRWLCYLVAETGMGEGWGPTDGAQQWVTLARALELCGTQPPAVPWASHLTHWPKAKEQSGGLQQKARIQLLQPSPPHTHQSPATGWITSLIWPHCQLVGFGRGPLWHQPVAEQDLLPGNRAQGSDTQKWLHVQGCTHCIMLSSNMNLFSASLILTFSYCHTNVVKPYVTFGV